jgi:hypothetical protein
VHDTAEAIDFAALPDRFAIKTNHGCGYNIIVRSSDQLDKKAAVNILRRWLSENYYYYYRERPYFPIEPKIMIEELLWFEDRSVDFKFYCFHGKVAFIQVVFGLADRHQHDECCYDVAWNLQPFVAVNPSSDQRIARPANLDQMITVAEKLAWGFDFVRVDLYNIEGRIYFGELTFFPMTGLVEFDPKEYGYRFGELLDLPDMPSNS